MQDYDEKSINSLYSEEVLRATLNSLDPNTKTTPGCWYNADGHMLEIITSDEDSYSVWLGKCVVSAVIGRNSNKPIGAQIELPYNLQIEKIIPDRATLMKTLGFELVFDSSAVNQAIDNIAKVILEDNKDDGINILGILNGGAYVVGRVISKLAVLNPKANINLSWVKAKRKKTNSGYAVDFPEEEKPASKITLLPNTHTLWILDDICDTGSTANCIINTLRWNVESLDDIHLVTLVNRMSVKSKKIEPTYSPLSLTDDRFLVGCGMDYSAEWFRNLDCIYGSKEFPKNE